MRGRPLRFLPPAGASTRDIAASGPRNQPRSKACLGSAPHIIAAAVSLRVNHVGRSQTAAWLRHPAKPLFKFKPVLKAKLRSDGLFHIGPLPAACSFRFQAFHPIVSANHSKTQRDLPDKVKKLFWERHPKNFFHPYGHALSSRSRCVSSGYGGYENRMELHLENSICKQQAEVGPMFHNPKGITLRPLGRTENDPG